MPTVTRNDIGRAVRMADRVSLKIGLAWLICVVVVFHAKQFPHFDRWFGWADQGRYLAAARAWAHWQLDPALHHYPPGYSLMAAPFVFLWPIQPFAVPDLLCFCAALIVFDRLLRRMTPDGPGWRTAGIVAFCLATTGSPTMRLVWSMPWNTTGSAPFELGALLAAVRLAEVPHARRGAVLGLMLGLLAGIRPSDAIVLTPCCAAYSAIMLRGLTFRRAVIVAGTGMAGLLAGCLPFALAHLAVHGGGGGFYMAKSVNIGFEWRLLPLRWVTLVLDPRPLLPEGMGIAEGLPWIVPGFGGMLLLMASHKRDAAAWRLVGVAMALHWMLYLSYRDLQPYGLWRFYNVHYFKWSFPFLVVAGLRLAAALADAASRRQAIIAAACSLTLLIWRPVGVANGHFRLSPDGAGGFALPGDLSSVNKAAFLPLTGTWRQIYFGPPTLSAGGQTFDHTRDFKLQPVRGGALLQPLRPFPPGKLLFHAGPGTQLAPGEEIVDITENLDLGLPCGVLPHRAGCQSPAYALQGAGTPPAASLKTGAATFSGR